MCRHSLWKQRGRRRAFCRFISIWERGRVLTCCVLRCFTRVVGVKILPARDPKCFGVFFVRNSGHQNPVVSLLQDLCVSISASRACRATCARSPYEDLVQDVCVKISAVGSCRSTCAKSVYADLLCKMFASGGFCRDFAQDLCMWISCVYLCVRICASGCCI